MASGIGVSATGAIAKDGPRTIRVTEVRTIPRLDRLALRDRPQQAALPGDVAAAVARIRPSIGAEAEDGAEVPEAAFIPEAGSASVTLDTPRSSARGRA